MKAVQYKDYGNPDVLKRVDDALIPVCGPHEIRIKVVCAGINPFDVKKRSGMMSKGHPLDAPIIPSTEASGIVDALGSEVTDTKIGDAVFGFAFGGAACEYALLSQWSHKPDNVSFETAGSVLVSAHAALRALNELDLKQGNTLFVHGGSGGVGQATIQMAIAKGLSVIADGSEKNQALIQSLGATPIRYGEHLVRDVYAHAPNGIDGIVDTSGTQLEDLLTIAKTPLKIRTLANYDGPSYGVKIPSYPKDSKQLLDEITGYLADGRLKVKVTGKFTLDQAQEAHRFVQTQHTSGRSVFIINENM